MSETSISNIGHSPANDNNGQHGGPPIVFMKESSLFGSRKVERNEWLKHSEMYGALSNIVNPSHITGLQRVNGMWRIYIDNAEDKVMLLNEGVSLRGKRVGLLNTNPNRLDSEQTIRVRIKNIPLSVEDGTITRTLILKGLDVIQSMREKLRYNGKLTHCETGDRLITVKATTLTTPLPRTMMFGKFIGRVIHLGHNNEQKVIKCRKCLEDGHATRDCTNDWKCLVCLKTGHRKGECQINNEEDDTENKTPEVLTTEKTEESKEKVNIKDDVASDSAKSVKSDRKVKNPKRKGRSTKDNTSKEERKQTLIDTFCSGGNKTPNKGKSSNVKNRTPPTPDEQTGADKKKRIDSDSDYSYDSSSNED